MIREIPAVILRRRSNRTCILLNTVFALRLIYLLFYDGECLVRSYMLRKRTMLVFSTVSLSIQ